MSSVAIVGGGAAGFFAAITCAESNPGLRVSVYERSPQFLAKVRISGGGRCNVTHGCFEARDFSKRYPRGERALIGPFQTFQARDTVDWFRARDVELKVEEDGRMFPVTDSSQTIIDCLMGAARSAGVSLHANRGIDRVERTEVGGYQLTLSDGARVEHQRLLIATGGCRAQAVGDLITSLGHTIEAPVPSLFTFHVNLPWLNELAGVSVNPVSVSVVGTPLKETGPLLVTHVGLSGPVILRVSAWGARALHASDYRFKLLVNWLPEMSLEALGKALEEVRSRNPAKQICNAPMRAIPSRLWEKLVEAAGIGRETRWSNLSRSAQHQLVQQMTRGEFEVSGKTMNKDEFVTCGGVRLSEVNFKTMESKLSPGLHFAGEVLDIDGVTGGFNFQAAWTTGWLAGKAMAVVR